MSNSYRRNHILSQCLLERFQDSSGNIVRYDIKRHKTKKTKPGLEGFRRDLWTKTSARFMEGLWNEQAEGSIRTVLERVDNKKRITQGELSLLAKFCALHFVRSHEFIKIYGYIREQKCSTLTMSPGLSFSERYMVRLQLLKNTGIPSKHFEQTMQKYYLKSAQYLQNIGVEIGMATGKNTFLLPDTGLVIADARQGRYQPSGGVALLQARQALIPLSPKLLLAFHNGVKRIRYQDLNDRQVEIANNNLIRVCHEYYYSALTN